MGQKGHEKLKGGQLITKQTHDKIFWNVIYHKSNIITQIY